MTGPQMFGNRNYIPLILNGSSQHFLPEAKLTGSLNWHHSCDSVPPLHQAALRDSTTSCWPGHVPCLDPLQFVVHMRHLYLNLVSERESRKDSLPASAKTIPGLPEWRWCCWSGELKSWILSSGTLLTCCIPPTSTSGLLTPGVICVRACYTSLC